MPPSYGDLRQGVLLDLNRSDLIDYASDALEDTIRFLQRSFFYATDQTDTLYTSDDGTAGGALGGVSYDLPADMVSLTYLRLNNAGNWEWMTKIDYEQILRYDTTIPPTKSTPTVWAPFDLGFRIYSTPDIVYQMELTGNGLIPIPDDDATVNFWTTEARAYVRYLTVSRVHRLRTKNNDAAAACEQLAEEERRSLMRVTVDRATDRKIAPHC